MQCSRELELTGLDLINTIPTLSFAISVTLDKLLNFYVPQFPNLQNTASNSTKFITYGED
jgi:hypothetical protein